MARPFRGSLSRCSVDSRQLRFLPQPARLPGQVGESQGKRQGNLERAPRDLGQPDCHPRRNPGAIRHDVQEEQRGPCRALDQPRPLHVSLRRFPRLPGGVVRHEGHDPPVAGAAFQSRCHGGIVAFGGSSSWCRKSVPLASSFSNSNPYTKERINQVRGNRGR